MMVSRVDSVYTKCEHSLSTKKVIEDLEYPPACDIKFDNLFVK